MTENVLHQQKKSPKRSLYNLSLLVVGFNFGHIYTLRLVIVIIYININFFGHVHHGKVRLYEIFGHVHKLRSS